MPLSWSHGRVGLEIVHVFSCLLLVSFSSLAGDAFFVFCCAGKEPTHILAVAALPPPFISGLETRSAVQGGACALAGSLVVHASPAGELCPTTRVTFIDDSVSSIRVASMASSSCIGAVGLRPMAPPSWWQPKLRLAGGADGQRRRRVYCVLPRKASSRRSSVVERSPETSGAYPCACLRVPSKDFCVIFLFAKGVSINCGSSWSHPCKLA